MKNALSFRLAAASAATVALLALSACSTAEVKDTWTAPDVTKLSFKNILVIAATSDGTARRTFEDSVVAAIPNAKAVPSYAFLTGIDISDTEKITAALKAASFDGVVVIRLISDRNDVSVNQTAAVPMGMGYGYGGYGAMGYPVGYRSFGGYYGSYGMASTTVTTTRILQLETNIYEFPGEKLVWSGVVESTAPGDVKQMAEDTVSAIRQQLIRQKLIAAPAK